MQRLRLYETACPKIVVLKIFFSYGAGFNENLRVSRYSEIMVGFFSKN